MFDGQRQEPRERPRPSSPGQHLLRHLEGLRVEAERLGAEVSPDDLNLPAICADLGLAGLINWRAHHDKQRTVWQLDSREVLVYDRVARLFSCWASVEWWRYWGHERRSAEAE